VLRPVQEILPTVALCNRALALKQCLDLANGMMSILLNAICRHTPVAQNPVVHPLGIWSRVTLIDTVDIWNNPIPRSV